MTYIPDPIERMQSRAESLEDRFVDEYTCMECNKKYDYEMICVDPMGMGPAVCVEFLGFGLFEKISSKITEE